MIYIVIIGLLITGIFFGFFMAYIIKWKLKNNKKASKIWHKLGWWVRFFPAMILLAYTIGQYEKMITYQLWYLLIAWIFWDFIINIVNKFGLLYIDRKGINSIIINIVIFILSLGKKISDEQKEKFAKIGCTVINITKMLTIVSTIVLTILYWNYL